MNVADAGTPPVLTVGHSTRTLEELIHLLQAHHVRTLVDIRTIPRSRRRRALKLVVFFSSGRSAPREPQDIQIFLGDVSVWAGFCACFLTTGL